MHRYALTVLVLVIIPKLASGDPTTLDVFTSFEFGDLGPTFGTSPVSATLVGGASVFEAVPSLYHNGSRSWRIDAGTTTTINFETPVSIVEFFALDAGTADAVVTAFSPGGTPIGSSINLTNSFPGPMNDFSNPFSLSGLGPIGSLDVNNPGDGAAYVDSFGFSAVPEPSAALLLVVGLVSLVRRRSSVSSRGE